MIQALIVSMLVLASIGFLVWKFFFVRRHVIHVRLIQKQSPSNGTVRVRTL